MPNVRASMARRSRCLSTGSAPGSSRMAAMRSRTPEQVDLPERLTGEVAALEAARRHERERQHRRANHTTRRVSDVTGFVTSTMRSPDAVVHSE